MSLPIQLPFSLKKFRTYRESKAANGADVHGAVDRYTGMHDHKGGDANGRRRDYVQLAKDYYNLATDFYERGWGQSFHFTPRWRDETFAESMMTYNHKVALMLGLKPGMEVADIGAGIGGPMRQIARFSGATVRGINTNTYQIEKGNRYNADAGLSSIAGFIEGDFMNMPVEDGTFDAAYALEATCHAPDVEGIYREIFRVLKPGARFFLTDWCMTDLYDPDNPEHVQIRRDIEYGDGLPDIRTIRQSRAALEKAGFEILREEDWALLGDNKLRWYSSLAGEELNFTGIRRTSAGKFFLKRFVKGLEKVGIAPKGASEVETMLNRGADGLVAGGQSGIFTPMAMFLVRKPGSTASLSPQPEAK